MDIEEILDDVRHEPAWRWVANREMAYRDCNQLDAEMLRAMESIGMLPIQRPMIGAIMDSVLGVEARTRRDWVVLANDDQDSAEAKALSKRLHEAERRSGADMAVSLAYEGQACVGVGWVEVGINRDPFGYPHRCYAPHRRELWWDWRGGSDPDDWRYIVRRKWYDKDVLARMFPGRERTIRQATAGYPGWASGIGVHGGMRDDDEELYRAGVRDWEVERDWAHGDAEWRDSARRRLCLFEVWYRQFEPGATLSVPGHDVVIEYEPENPRHQALVQMGLAEVRETIVPRMRLAYWVGPHKLADVPTPYPHHEFPYVPFLGFTDDRNGMYYGLIRRMMSGQDQINAGLTKMFYLMSSTLVMGDEDAFAIPLDDVAEQVGLKNAVVPLNPDRKNPGQKPEIQTDRQLAAQHFQALQEAQQTLGANAGIHNAYQGKATDQQSGIAINSLVEQSTTGLAKLNARYGWARKKVGELLLANELARMSGVEFAEVVQVKREKVTVAFNAVERDESTGQARRSNDLSRLRTRVELADMPATASYKQQMAQGLMSLVETLPDDLKGPLIPMLVRSHDFPDREEVAQLLESQLGIGGEQDPMVALQQQRAQAMQAEGERVALELAQAKAEVERGKASKLEAEVEQLRAEIAQMAEQIRASLEQQAMARAVTEGAMQIRPQAPQVPMG